MPSGSSASSVDAAAGASREAPASLNARAAATSRVVAAGANAFLSLRGVTKSFDGVKALDDVSLDLAEGELVCFLGPSGCGKTTLLRIVAGLETPDAAEVRFGGRDLTTIPARERNFGIVFQSYSLFPNMTVARNIAYGLECRKWRREDIPGRVAEMLALVNLADQAGKLPHQLSGGQQQRVALARALAPKPAVLLLDEPLSALDAKVREDLRAEIKDLQSQLRITTIMVTHDQHEAMELADRIVVMNCGRIEQVGRPVELYEQPATRFVAGFVGRMNVVRGLHDRPLAGVRPEHVELIADGIDGPDRRTARVKRAVFLGSITRVTVAIDGEPLTLELMGRRDDLVPGRDVTVRIPAHALLKLDGAS